VDVVVGRNEGCGTIIVDVVVGRNEGCGTMVKGNDNDEWSSNGAVLWLERRQNGDVIERWAVLPRLR
jgi:hypothetical protein